MEARIKETPKNPFWWLAFLPALVALIGVGVSWGENNQRNNEQDRRLEQIERERSQITDVKIQQGRIEERVKSTNQQLEEIKGLLEDIRDRR